MRNDPADWAKNLQKYDIHVTKARFPRLLKSKKKRINRKWLKRYGHTTVYTNCAVTGLVSDTTTVYGMSTGFNASLLQVEKKLEGNK